MQPADSGDRGPEYARMIEALRGFLDSVAGAKPDIATIERLTGDLRRWTAELASAQVPEREQLFGRRRDLPGRGQTMIPAFVVAESGDDAIRGSVTFGRYFLGGNGAAHGGAITLLFDDVLGRVANAGGRRPARTAYLNVDYRAVTPLHTELTVIGAFVREEGRKRFVRGELWLGETLCAEAEALFIELLPHHR
jgi:acyl-coenzyme A thioesterase PaaI-like protein